MNHRELSKQFGRNPNLSAVIVYAVQQALRPFGCNHGDPSRSRMARLRALERRAIRRLKVRAQLVQLPDTYQEQRSIRWD